MGFYKKLNFWKGLIILIKLILLIAESESVIMASHQIPAFGFPRHGVPCVPGCQPQNLFHFRLERANGSRHDLVNGIGLFHYKSDVKIIIFIQGSNVGSKVKHPL